jgi:hypothetical protein
MAHNKWQQEFIEILEGSTLGSSRVEEAIAFKQNHLPRRIYKYREVCVCSLDCLETNSVWMASPDSYNDPYDSSIMLPTASIQRKLEARLAKTIIEKYRLDNHLPSERLNAAISSPEPLKTLVGYFPELPSVGPNQDWKSKAAYCSAEVTKLSNAARYTIAEWRKFAKICSFSEVPDSLLMWSHYADHHRGLCIEYDLEALGDPNHFFRKNLYPVLYSSDFYNLDPFVKGLSGGPETRGSFQPMLPLLAMLTKFQGWEYEREWRLFQETSSITGGAKKEAPVPSRIFLGPRFDPSLAEGPRLISICREKQIPLLRMRLGDDKFELKAETPTG